MFLKLVFVFKQINIHMFWIFLSPFEEKGRSLNMATTLFYCSHDMQEDLQWFFFCTFAFPLSYFQHSFVTLLFLELIKPVFPGERQWMLSV